MRSRTPSLFLPFLIVIAASASLWGQSTATDTVVGAITDQSGAVIPNPQVTRNDAETGRAPLASTNSAVNYLFADLDGGKYNLTSSKPGFATKAKAEVKVGLTVTANLTFQVGGCKTTGKVHATTRLQRMNSTVGNDTTRVALDALARLVNGLIQLG